MNILAIETATAVCAIGLRTTDGFELGWVVDEDRHHTEVLTSSIARALAQLDLRARDLDRVVVDRGPGLFTGLRVGLATALGLSEGTGCSLVAVTSLELLAHGAHEEGTRGTLVCCVDGRRGEVFIQNFRLDDEVTALTSASVAVPRAVVIEWATNGAPVTFTGDGVERYLRDFAAVPNGTLEHQSVPSIAAALRLGATREPVAQVEPMYLREADAVANFSTRQRS
ncbi:MAG: tRNA (adenosine(37)-N6)-threonylcarbamoyltransferase complex dimerization subunit type 1 TsaB [Acidimicrobiaceae bacterium]|nr:tRNA (adenosine(37)-N6)-threonylcarbamoyltransferase complex dimerization subunit type 1 TsaB [Acidimicrobiaceae bacterium]